MTFANTSGPVALPPVRLIGWMGGSTTGLLASAKLPL